MQSPFRLPALLEFNCLKALVSGERTSAEDTVRSLRDNPGFFEGLIGDWSEYRQEKLLDTHGAHHPVLDKPLVLGAGDWKYPLGRLW